MCLGDPLGSLPDLASTLGNALAPDWRVIALAPRPELPYQAQAVETLRLLDTFGFEQPVLLGSGLASGVALLLAAWYPNLVDGLILVNPGLTRARRHKLAILAADTPAWRAWLDAPPAWARVESQVTCPVLRLPARTSAPTVEPARAFLHRLRLQRTRQR